VASSSCKFIKVPRGTAVAGLLFLFMVCGLWFVVCACLLNPETRMKTYVTFLLIIAGMYAKSQDTVNLVLFKQGTRLEYKNYMWDPNSYGKKKKAGELTRVILTVDSITNTNGVIKSYITKKGIAANNPDYSYKKNFVIQSDGKRVILPYALYMVDTTYTSDINVVGMGMGKGKYFWSLDVPRNALAFLVPPSLNGVHDITFDKKTIKGKMWQKDLAQRRENDMEYTIRKMYVDGQAKVTTKAGTFDCYKIIMEQEVVIVSKHMIARLELYYNEPNGIVMVNHDSGFMELGDIRLNDN
jgi:hypothetical protein